MRGGAARDEVRRDEGSGRDGGSNDSEEGLHDDCVKELERGWCRRIRMRRGVHVEL